jgi:SAM-dependent methyltransferase
MTTPPAYTALGHVDALLGKERSPAGYHLVSEFPGWEGAVPLLRGLIERYRPRVVFEVGSGANPTLDPADVQRFGVRYITSDNDADELKLAPDAFESCCLDLEGDAIPPELIGSCDLIFSRMVNEHISDGEKYHRNLYALLAPGGIAVHCFAALGTLPFLVNRFMADGISSRLFGFFAPRDEQHKKFRAFYSWSRGPTRDMTAKLQRLGYEVVRYDGYYGHMYYKKRLPLLHRLELAKSRALLTLKVPQLCDYGVMILRKPA